VPVGENFFFFILHSTFYIPSGRAIGAVVAQQLYTLWVGGSNPSSPTILSNFRTQMFRACLKIPGGTAARSIGRGLGGEAGVGAPPEGAQRAVPTGPTTATTKRPAAQRVFPPRITRLRCSTVEGSPGISASVSSPTPVWVTKTGPLVIFRHALRKLNILVLVAVAVLCGCKTVTTPAKTGFSRFVGVDDFSKFSRLQNEKGETVLVSPEIKSKIRWNELVVSWNATAAAGTCLKVEARAISPDHTTKFYTLGNWSPDDRIFPRSSLRNQQDAGGGVDTDTLILTQPADAAQIRVTLGGTNGALPVLGFLGASFANTKVPPATRPPNRKAWGKIIATPERSQQGYPNANGWCSPASLSMVLARWSEILDRPEMNLTVPEVAAGVYDDDFAGTGNWPFNTAFAGGFRGMRSYVTRFDDVSEVEDWIAAGIPVILSARWDWLSPGRPLDSEGHLIVCIGFTKAGDVIVNDPAAHLDRGQSVRQIYQRADVIHSWSKSHNTIYLVYPVNAKIPENRYGHW
jgi:hypothetical protein